MSRPTPGPGRRGVPPFDARTVHPLDWVILAAGALAFVFSLFDYYHWTIPTAVDYSDSLFRSRREGFVIELSAWHGFFGWAATVLAVVGAALVALELLAPQLRLVSLRLPSFVAFALATVCVVLARFFGSFVGPRAVALGIVTGRGVGYWGSLVVIVLGTVAATLRWRAVRTSGPDVRGERRGLPGAASAGR